MNLQRIVLGWKGQPKIDLMNSVIEFLQGPRNECSMETENILVVGEVCTYMGGHTENRFVGEKTFCSDCVTLGILVVTLWYGFAR